MNHWLGLHTPRGDDAKEVGSSSRPELKYQPLLGSLGLSVRDMSSDMENPGEHESRYMLFAGLTCHSCRALPQPKLVSICLLTKGKMRSWMSYAPFARAGDRTQARVQEASNANHSITEVPETRFKQLY